MRARSLLLTSLVALLLGCSGIQDLMNGGGDEDEATSDDPPPPPPPDVDEAEEPAEDEWVTETTQLEVALEVNTGGRSKLAGMAREQLEAAAKEKGYAGVKKVRLQQVECQEVCKATATGEAWRKVKKK